jgi:uncharacterized protein YecT (DUF1311 family)
MAHVVPALVGLCSLLLVVMSRPSRAGTIHDATRAAQPRCSTPLECQKAANAAFRAEAARIGKDCRGARNQREATGCERQAADTTERNLSDFYTALEGIVGSEPLSGPQETWLAYRRKQCDAIFTFFGRGSIAPSAQIRCEIALARSRMRDLEELFDVQLHH